MTPDYQALLDRIAALEARLGDPLNVPNPVYETDLNGLLTHVRMVGNARVDPVVGDDCPGTVFMPQTGHVLSVPRPDLGEMFMGYCQRVSDQAHGNIATVGALVISSSRLFARFGGFKSDGSNWAEAADCFYNLRAYMSVAERAQADAAKESWQAVYDRMRSGGQGTGGGKHGGQGTWGGKHGGGDAPAPAPTPEPGETPL